MKQTLPFSVPVILDLSLLDRVLGTGLSCHLKGAGKHVSISLLRKYRPHLTQFMLDLANGYGLLLGFELLCKS